MGETRFSRAAYTASTEAHIPKVGPTTARAEQEAKKTGKLHELVDPAGYGVIRRSLLRFDELPNGLFKATIGTSVPVETRLDTTGSMGSNVDVAVRVLPTAFELCQSVLPGCDLHIATGIFGDVSDRFVLCRPQFEMIAEKIVQQLSLMVPERAGGDTEEDPHYGLFGAAYLTAWYINRIKLKGYDFTITDAPARDQLDEKTLIRVFGKQVFEKVAQRGHQIDKNNLPSTQEVVRDMLDRAHGFLLQVGDSSNTRSFWTRIFGKDRVITLPRTELIPQVQAVVIGLTEGTLDLGNAKEFLQHANVPEDEAKAIIKSVSKIPIGEQAALPNFGKRPKAGDIFESKTALWPLDPEDPRIKDEKPRKKKKGDKPQEFTAENPWL